MKNREPVACGGKHTTDLGSCSWLSLDAQIASSEHGKSWTKDGCDAVHEPSKS